MAGAILGEIGNTLNNIEMEVQGRISKIMPMRKGTRSDGSEWRSQEFIVEFFETADQRWSDKVVLSAMNERIDEYDLHEGEEVMWDSRTV